MSDDQGAAERLFSLPKECVGRTKPECMGPRDLEPPPLFLHDPFVGVFDLAEFFFASGGHLGREALGASVVRNYWA